MGMPGLASGEPVRLAQWLEAAREASGEEAEEAAREAPGKAAGEEAREAAREAVEKAAGEAAKESAAGEAAPDALMGLDSV